MNASRTRGVGQVIIALMMLGPLTGSAGGAPLSDDAFTAVAAHADKSYVRKKLPDGTFLTEYYTFGDGGRWRGNLGDPTIDPLKFLNVARTLATPLAAQQYLPTHNPDEARLLIMVYWGTTNGSADDPGLSRSKAAADMNNRHNARMLGFDGVDFTPSLFHRFANEEMVDAIRESRYFVILMAYDFQALRTRKSPILLWETRLSFGEHHSDFGADLPMRAQYASRYFGQNVDGLHVRTEREAHVDVGEPVVIDYQEPKK